MVEIGRKVSKGLVERSAFVRIIITCYEHIDFLLYLTADEVDDGLGGSACYGVTVHTLDARWAGIDRLDVKLTAGEYVRHLVENAGNIFREDMNGIECCFQNKIAE